MAKRYNKKQKKRFKKNSAFAHNFYLSDEWAEIRIKVLQTYGNRCMKCARLTSSPHVDHIRPRSKYSTLRLDFNNLQVLCATCNEEKGTSVADYRTKILPEPGTVKKPPTTKRNDFYRPENENYRNTRTLTRDEIKSLGFNVG